MNWELRSEEVKMFLWFVLLFNAETDPLFLPHHQDECGVNEECTGCKEALYRINALSLLLAVELASSITNTVSVLSRQKRETLTEEQHIPWSE